MKETVMKETVMKKLALAILSALSLLVANPSHADSVTLTQGSATRKIAFLLVQSADHVTPLTGATPVVTISKNGGTFAAPVGATAELANGWYVLSPTSSDTSAVGSLIVHATATGADPADLVENVVAYNGDDAASLGLSNVTVAASGTTANGVSLAALKSANILGTGSVTSATTPTGTSFGTTLTAPTDLISGDGLIFTSGVNAGKNIHILTNSAGLFGLPGAGLATPPSVGDTFVLIPFSKSLTSYLAALGTDNRPILSANSQPALSVSNPLPAVDGSGRVLMAPAQAYTNSTPGTVAPTWYTAPPTAAAIAAVTSTYAFDGPPTGTILALTITHNSSSQPVLTWVADPLATGYKVLRSTDGTNYTQIAAPAVGTLTYTDTARPNNTTVYYHIVSTH